MKKNRNHKATGNGSSNQAVRFEFTHPTAKSVSVAGTFNDWRPGAIAMVPVGRGRWLKELILPPGIYEYRLVVDNEWMADPLATETAPNPFGGINSIVKVPQPREGNDEKLPLKPHEVATKHEGALLPVPSRRLGHHSGGKAFLRVAPHHN